MEELHKRILKDNHLRLIEDLDLKSSGSVFFAYLIQARIITSMDQESITAFSTNHAVNGEFLRLLPSKGPRAFKAFIGALRASGRDHLADDLSPMQDGPDGFRDDAMMNLC